MEYYDILILTKKASSQKLYLNAKKRKYKTGVQIHCNHSHSTKVFGNS